MRLWIGTATLGLMVFFPLACSEEDGPDPVHDVAQSMDVISGQDPGNSAVDSGFDVSAVTEVSEGLQGIRYAVMPVHMEPGSPPVHPILGTMSFDRPKAYFPSLVSLVVMADVYEHKLTLMFSPQWAAYVLHPTCQLPMDESPGPGFTYQGQDYSNCLDLVRAMEGHGHEIALHHHPLTAPSSWDGFTNDESWSADRDKDGVDESYKADGSGLDGPDPFYLGTVSDMMAWLDQLPAAGSGNIVTATTEEYPESIRFAVRGGYEAYENVANPGHLVSRPCATGADGHWVWKIHMRLFTSVSNQNAVLTKELPQAISDFESTGGGPYILGFVTHAKNVDETGSAPFSNLFAELKELGITIERAQDVMAHYAETQEPPSLALPSLHCPPESQEP